MSAKALYLDLKVLLNLKELIMLSKKNLDQIAKQGLTSLQAPRTKLLPATNRLYDGQLRAKAH